MREICKSGSTRGLCVTAGLYSIGVAVSNFYKWRDKFIESGKKGFYETSSGNTYEREINDLKRLVGDQALVIDELKKNYRGRKR